LVALANTSLNSLQCQRCYPLSFSSSNFFVFFLLYFNLVVPPTMDVSLLPPELIIALPGHLVLSPLFPSISSPSYLWSQPANDLIPTKKLWPFLAPPPFLWHTHNPPRFSPPTLFCPVFSPAFGFHPLSKGLHFSPPSSLP